MKGLGLSTDDGMNEFFRKWKQKRRMKIPKKIYLSREKMLLMGL